MGRIYIDITNLVEVKFLTGIQRVVRNVVLEMNQYRQLDVVFLNYNFKIKKFEVIKEEKMIDFLKGDLEKKESLQTAKFIDCDEMEPGSIFFDLDSVWNSKYKRSSLLPRLKKQGVRLAVYIYDIIPITHPQFAHTNTLFTFMDYLGAYLQYADILITSTQTTLDELNKLMEKLNLNPIPGFVSWLGSDFHNQASITGGNIPTQVVNAAKSKYVLCVGTIEPRKNHALILDAFEKELFTKGLNLIFVGRVGWNIDEFVSRMKKSAYYKKQFFFLEGLDDTAVDYLYEHAYLLAFPTIVEGFGLPMIEALERGLPVIATDCPVLREVGQDYCDYFESNNVDAVIRCVNKYIENPEQYEQLKKHVTTFVPFTWKQTTEKIVEALQTLESECYQPNRQVKQMVFLTARLEAMRKTLPYIDAFMPFIEEIILCCPDKMATDMQNIFEGRLKISIITDGQLLGGRALPKDHTERNFLLRCSMMQQDSIDSVFIMGDDDYRPLKVVSLDTFMGENTYKAYYCYSDMAKWFGTIGCMTSYDYSMCRTNEFLEKNKYPNKLYAAHMPQIIDKTLYCELLEEHSEIQSMGLDEWSTYFNYVQYRYPELIESKPYLTMGWPGSGTDWKIDVEPSEMLFENYYEELYAESGIFEGFSQEYYEGIGRENEKKIMLYRNDLKRYILWQTMFGWYQARYRAEYGENPIFLIREENQQILIDLPRMLEIPEKGFVRLPWKISRVSEEPISIFYQIKDSLGLVRSQSQEALIDVVGDVFELPVFGIDAGKYIFVVQVLANKKQYECSVPVLVIES